MRSSSGHFPLLPSAWMFWTTTSFPDPVGPMTRTGRLEPATIWIRRPSSRIGGDEPTRGHGRDPSNREGRPDPFSAQRTPSERAPSSSAILRTGSIRVDLVQCHTGDCSCDAGCDLKSTLFLHEWTLRREKCELAGSCTLLVREDQTSPRLRRLQGSSSRQITPFPATPVSGGRFPSLCPRCPVAAPIRNAARVSACAAGPLLRDDRSQTVTSWSASARTRQRLSDVETNQVNC